MRRRLVVGSLAAVAVATLLFALPLAVVFGRLYESEASEVLEREALRVAGALSASDLAGTSDVALLATQARALLARGTLATYGADGGRLSGTGPGRLEPAGLSVTRSGNVWTAHVGAEVVVAVPDFEDGRVVAVVRAAEPHSEVDRRTYRAWALLAALAAVAAGVAVVVGQRQARHVAAPMERLVRGTRALAEGDFAVRLPASGIAEIDRANEALTSTAGRLGALLEREHNLADDASHQLRTPLTGLRLALEAALAGPDDQLRGRVRTASEAADRLAGTIDDLLSLRRPPPSGRGPGVTAAEIGALVTQRWRRELVRAGRSLDVTVSAGDARAAVSVAGLRQALDALLENALRHGHGTVTVTVRRASDAVAVDVADEGDAITLPAADLFRRGTSTAGGSGIGLALAESVVRAEGGRVDLSSRTPTRFTVLVPGAPADGSAAVPDVPAPAGD